MINRDFRELFAAFVAHDVRFLIVGGYAVAFHGHPRYTTEADVLVARDPENARRVYEALVDFGAPGTDLGIDAFTDPQSILQIGVPPNRVDVLTELSGIGFEEAWASRVFSRYGDVPVGYIGLDGLLKSKRAAGRPQDLLDAEELERRNADRRE